MKQYVLELAPGPVGAVRPPPLPAQEPGPRFRGSGWRTVALLVLIEPIALGGLYWALVGGPETSRAPGPGIAPVMAPPTPRPERAVVRDEPATGAEPAPVPASLPHARVTPSRGGYAIDLRSAAPGTAVALLAKATGAKVSGEQIFDGSAVRLTHQSVAPTVRDAWQAVFGDVASFAVSCPRGGCEVRFVSLVHAAAPPQGAVPTRMVEQLVQGVSIPTPAPAPVEQGRAAPLPRAAPPSTDDPNAAEN